jgi:hypothetical protein
MNASEKNASELDMLVIQFGDRTLKGYADRSQWPAEEDLGQLRVTPPIRAIGSEIAEPIPLEGVKAIFFVKSFEGKWHDDLRFHDHLPPPECLWVRATFDDGEIIEGLVANNCRFVAHAGFYMFPIDPEGNNWLMYVLKNKLKEFHILGLRPAPKNMPRLNPAVAASSV